MILQSIGDYLMPSRMAEFSVQTKSNVARADLAGGGSAVLGVKNERPTISARGILVRGEDWAFDADRWVDGLRGLVGVEKEITTKYADESRRVLRCILKTVDTSTNVSNAAAGIVPVSLEFESVDEYWHGEGLTPRVFTSATATECGNMGNAAQWERLKITITSATLTGLVITNTRNGQYCTVNVAKPSGDLILDVGTMLATANSVDIYASVAFPATQTRFLQLEPGANRLTFSQAVTGRIEYRACWR